jgi:pimeloyl-ACP methyl ester carboxylesterase
MATMLMVSCRKDFWSATDFSSADEIRRVDLDTGKGTVVSQNEFLQAVQSKRLIVLVHGYNNEELDVVKSYATIDEQMRLLGFVGGNAAAYDGLVGFAWPGGAHGVSFPFARQRAGDSASRFARLLSDLRNAGATIDLNTHSLGAHVAFEALRDGPPQVVRNSWNFASAVDNESIERAERYYHASRRCQNFYVFHSKNDPVLRIWYRVGDLFDFDTALGYSGPEDPGAIIQHSPNVRVINCKDVVQAHGGYRSAGQVWAYMSQELTTPAPSQFVTLAKTPEALDAVFRTAVAELPGRAARTAGRSRKGGRARPRRARRES